MGSAAYFIRFGGCDVGCPWCDVKESWDANQHEITPVDHIIKGIPKQCQIAVVTGGEPLMWPMDYLTTQLKEKGLRTHIETSGAYEVTGDWDWFCLSPKKRQLPTQSAYKNAHELKMVVRTKADFDFATTQAQKVNDECLLYLQAEWSKRAKITPLMVDFVKENPHWNISVQIHKYLDIP